MQLYSELRLPYGDRSKRNARYVDYIYANALSSMKNITRLTLFIPKLHPKLLRNISGLPNLTDLIMLYEVFSSAVGNSDIEALLYLRLKSLSLLPHHRYITGEPNFNPNVHIETLVGLAATSHLTVLQTNWWEFISLLASTSGNGIVPLFRNWRLVLCAIFQCFTNLSVPYRPMWN